MPYAKNVVIGWSEFELAGPIISWHRINLNQSKTKAKNLNSAGQWNGSMARMYFSQFGAISCFTVVEKHTRKQGALLQSLPPLCLVWGAKSRLASYNTWPGCEGVVRSVPEGAGRMVQSKPERSEGYNVIICPAPKGAGWTTPEQTGHYSHYNTKLTHSPYFHGYSYRIALTEPPSRPSCSWKSSEHCHPLCTWINAIARLY